MSTNKEMPQPPQFPDQLRKDPHALSSSDHLILAEHRQAVQAYWQEQAKPPKGVPGAIIEASSTTHSTSHTSEQHQLRS